jgi:hypothetical protein
VYVVELYCQISDEPDKRERAHGKSKDDEPSCHCSHQL